MGLDISAYRKITPAPADWLDEDGEVSDGHWDKVAHVHRVDDFGEHARGIPEGEVFCFEESMGFRAGSYGSYDQWRETLAKMVGYPLTTFSSHFGNSAGSHAAACWSGDRGSFFELINFSDCEGAIGPIVAAKLAKDFADWDERAKLEDGHFYEKYQDWRTAMEMAADGGVVCFH